MCELGNGGQVEGRNLGYRFASNPMTRSGLNGGVFLPFTMMASYGFGRSGGLCFGDVDGFDLKEGSGHVGVDEFEA